MPVIPFIGFAPDLPDTTPGVITFCQAIPSFKGMRHAPIKVNVSGVSALPATCIGAATLRKIDGTARVFAGTATKLYELVGTTWTDRSAGGGSYTSAARWVFAQFGDISLATNDADNIQQSSSGAFAAIANAPKARIVITVPNFAIAFNTQNGSASSSFGDSPDRWWCSAYQNATDWAISATNQCVSERIVEGGEFTAAARFGEGWVAYKRRGMFHADYTGGDEVFTTRRVPGDVGCLGPEAVCDIGNAHFVVGEDDIYIYDGSRPVSVAAGKVREYFRTRLNRTYQHLVSVRHDAGRGVVWVLFPVFGGPIAPSEALVYHIATGKWGATAIGSNSPGVANASLMYPSDTGSDPVAVIGGTSGEFLGTLDGEPTVGSGGLGKIVTGWFGSDDAESFFYRAQLLCDTRPSTALAQLYERNRSGADGPFVDLYTDSGGNLDFRRTAHWIALAFTELYGPFEAVGIDIHSRPAGVGR